MSILLVILLYLLASAGIFLSLNFYLFRTLTLDYRPILLILRLLMKQRRFPSIPFSFAVSVSLVAFAILTVFVLQHIRHRILDFRNRNRGSQGTSRWATDRELLKKKFARKNPGGIVIGELFSKVNRSRHREIICNESEAHVLVVGATGSGKGVGIIMPTLLTWKDSVIIVDPKGESYEIAGGYRSTFSNVFYFNPRSEKSCSINPLDFIPRTNAALGEIASLCMTIHPDKGKDPFWDQTARMLLEMLVCHVFVKGREHSLPEAAMIIQQPKSYEALFQDILKEYEDDPISPDDPLKSVADRAMASANHFYQMTQGQDSQQVVTHMTSVKHDLDPYSDPVSSKAFRTSSFRFKDIIDGKRPMSLYFCLSVSELAKSMPVFKMVYSVILKAILAGPQKHEHKLLLILDEFSQFKKFEVIEEQIPFVRGYGIRIMAIIQSLGQLQMYYGNEGTKALVDNFDLKVFMRASDNETCAWFERLLGKATLLMKKTSLSSSRRKQGIENWTEGTSEVGRSLLDAAEIMRLPPEEELLFIPFCYPYRARKIRYYKDSRFTNRINLPLEAPDIVDCLLLEDKRESFEEKASGPVVPTEEMKETGFLIGEREENTTVTELKNLFSSLREIGLEPVVMGEELEIEPAVEEEEPEMPDEPKEETQGTEKEDVDDGYL